MGFDTKPGETKTVMIVQGIPAADVIKNITGWLNSALSSIHRVVIHNQTKTSEVKISFVQHECHITVIDTEFKFYNEETHAKEEEPGAEASRQTETTET